MKRSIFAALAATALVGVASAKAETLQATWALDEFGVVATWDQSSDPAPLDYATGLGTKIAIWDFSSAYVGPYTAIVYFNASTGDTFVTPDGAYYVGGPQAYLGSEDAPMFAPGVFHGTYDTLASTLTLTAVPEASTWALTVAGFAATAALSFYRRRRVSLVG